MNIVQEFLSSKYDSGVMLLDYLDGLMATLDKPLFQINNLYDQLGKHEASVCKFNHGIIYFVKFHDSDAMGFVVGNVREADSDNYNFEQMLHCMFVEEEDDEELIKTFKFENLEDLITDENKRNECLEFIFNNLLVHCYEAVLDRSGETGHYNANDETLKEQFKQFLENIQNIYLPNMQAKDIDVG